MAARRAWASRVAALAAALLAALVAAQLLPSDAADYVVVVAVFGVFGVVMFALDRILPGTGSLHADAERAFRLTQSARGSRWRRGHDALPADRRLPLLDPAVEDRASRRSRGVETIPIAAIAGTTEAERAAAFDRDFNPPRWAAGRWQLMWIADRRGMTFPPISVYRVGERYYVRDGHHRVSVARALGAEQIEADVVELGG